MRVAIIVFLLTISGIAQGTNGGGAKSSGECSVAHNGSYDTITIQNCGIGAEQGDKIIDLIKAVLLNQNVASTNAKLDQLLKIVSGIGPPPERHVTDQDAGAVIGLLKRAPNGSRVRFTIIGGDREINTFANRIAAIFQWTQGTWIIDDVSLIGGTTNMGAGNIVSHGEGFHCSVANSTSGAGAIAISALARSGYPCIRDPDTEGSPSRHMSDMGKDVPPPPPVDLYITIGTRIVPQ